MHYKSWQCPTYLEHPQTQPPSYYRNCIYYWKCTKPNCKDFPKCEYIGLTSGTFKTRIGEHKQYVRSNLQVKPSGFRFNQPGHDLSHFSGLVLEHVRSEDPFVLRAREFLLMQKFDTHINRLNKELWKFGCYTSKTTLIKHKHSFLLGT